MKSLSTKEQNDLVKLLNKLSDKWNFRVMSSGTIGLYNKNNKLRGGFDSIDEMIKKTGVKE